MGGKKILKAKRLKSAMRLCTGTPETTADKIRFARLSAGLRQEELADKIGVSKDTILRYENEHVDEEHYSTEWLMQIALACGLDKHYCCSPYHIFLIEDAGKQIKQYRKNKKLTQKAFALNLGVSRTTVKRWEKNENKPPKSVWELVVGHKPIDM